jgi:CubicO group peptidase (beta-lactamase class C family)
MAMLLLALLLLLLAVALVTVAAASSSSPASSRSAPPRSAGRQSPSAPRTVADLPAGWEAQVDQFIANLTRCYQVIGLSVNVVLANESIYAKGFGVTDLSTKQPVDADTLFAIGSTTKAFTSTLLALLMDEGYFKNGWQTLVRDISPTWSFLDPFMSERATLADLLAMKSGLSIQPLMMFKNDTRTNSQQHLHK